jgi:riboflavin kinase/FMN adenylyltransferase
LTELGRQAGFTVISYPELRLRGETVSSSRIRELIQKGDLSRARALLGRAFSITALPAKGRGYGRRYTVPTINLSSYAELVPGNGVYITRTRIGIETFDSVTNVGNRPTFGADSFAIESHLLDFHPIDLTEETPIETCFLRRLRNEIRFPSVEALRAQIGKDVAQAQRYFRLL